MTNPKLYINYGCGLDAPENWLNFDASPTLRIQRIPLLGYLLKDKLNVRFPSTVKYGDIVKGLPGIQPGSCKGIYCSHVLEHLALEDFRKALKNTYTMLSDEGIFRLVVPDLNYYIEQYLENKNNGRPAALIFMEGTLMGVRERKKGLSGIADYLFSGSKHLWMWDYDSLKKELESVGFKKIRRCEPGDSRDEMFKQVENPARFKDSVGIECTK